MIKEKNIFITGGAGFIGTALAKKLIHDNKIIIFDNFHRDTISNSSFINHKNLKIIKGDVLDFDQLLKCMKGINIVIHAAAIAGIDTVIKSPTRTMHVNMIGTYNVLKAAHQNQVDDRIIDFSTSEVFGSHAFKSREDSDTISGSAGEARWTYSVSKLAGEHLAMAYHREFGLPITSVRPFNIYGPGQTGEGAMQIFIKRALNNENIIIRGDGNQIRAWCYIDDFIDGLLKCIYDNKAIGESFNIGNAKAVLTIYGLAQTVCRVLGSSSKINFKPAISADVELRIPSIDKARDLLGFNATIEIEDGIFRTAEWIKNQ